MPLPPFLTSNQALKNTNWCFKCDFMFIYSNKAAKPHSCGDEDLRNKFPVVVSSRDNVKTKGSSQTFLSEDLSWDIVLSDNCYTLSWKLFFKCSKIIQLAFLNFQCPGVTWITIPTRISHSPALNMQGQIAWATPLCQLFI